MTIRSFGLARALGVLCGLGCALHTTSSLAQDAAASADVSASWALQKELVLQPTFLYRLPGIVTRLTPYVGIGRRLYFLESVVRGNAGGQRFRDTPARSTKLGFGVPLGAEFQIGPGGLFGELFPHWARLKHATTASSHLGGMSLFVGYRAAL